MSMHAAIAPLALALSGLPALVIAAWVGGKDDDRARGLGLRWALIGLAILLGAAALYWTGGQRTGVYAVAIVLLLTVNALIVSMLLHLRRSDAARRERS
ncbi:uncharacterized membrane protein YtjA (UPF0391 family) [Xanthomonas arboricola]|nr:uncharacterized membrane protein YtjA (UPF0391 family) [Xanthomonas sp. 3307]